MVVIIVGSFYEGGLGATLPGQGRLEGLLALVGRMEERLCSADGEDRTGISRKFAMAVFDAAVETPLRIQFVLKVTKFAQDRLWSHFTKALVRMLIRVWRCEPEQESP